MEGKPGVREMFIQITVGNPTHRKTTPEGDYPYFEDHGEKKPPYRAWQCVF